MYAMRRTIVLVSCCGPKLAHAAPARELYTSQLFRLASAWAESQGHEWAVLSALYHVVQPDQVVEPYDRRVPTKRNEWNAWAKSTRGALMDLTEGEPCDFINLAGADYDVNVTSTMRLSQSYPTGHTMTYPLAGLGIGQRLQWLSRELHAAQTLSLF